jgi:hypothetical protein
MPNHIIMKRSLVILMLMLGRLICFSQDTSLVVKAKAQLNVALISQLDSIYHHDQDLRPQFDKAVKKYGWPSKEALDIWQMIGLKDSIDQIKVCAIIDKYGWLGADIVGARGNMTLFLVIQHANSAIQEKYLPLLREAVKKGSARGADLALLEDRVALGNGKKQVYGSQITSYEGSNKTYVSPLEDPDNVDKRRAEVGLPPMKVYLRDFHMRWALEQYKKDLPTIEAMEKLLHEKANKN